MMVDLPQRYGIAALVVLGLRTYGSTVFLPIVVADDWYWIHDALNDRLTCPDWRNVRPLSECWRLVLYRVFGVDLVMFRAAALLASMLGAVLLYLLLGQLWLTSGLVALSVAALFLVHPADLSRAWMSMGSNWAAYDLFLAGSVLLTAFWRGRGWWAWAVAMGLVVLSLGIYEAHIGLALAYSVALFLASGTQTLAHRLALLAPALLVILFVLWRGLASSLPGVSENYGMAEASLSPLLLLERMVLGYRTTIQWAWTLPLLRVFPWLTSLGGDPGVTATVAVAGLAGFLLLVGVAAARLGLLRHLGDSPVTRGLLARRWLPMLGTGLLAVGAAYFPVIVRFSPHMGFIHSRLNSLASIGAAMTVVAALGLTAVFLGGRSGRAEPAYVFMVACLVFASVAVQFVAQRDAVLSWREQKRVWQQLLALAPDLAPNTTVLLLVPQYPDRLAWPFEAAVDHIGDTLWVLYGHGDLEGYYVYGGLEALGLVERGIRVDLYGQDAWIPDDLVIPYGSALLLRYDRDTGQLEKVRRVTPARGEAASRPIDLCAECVLPQPTLHTDLRWLVE